MFEMQNKQQSILVYFKALLLHNLFLIHQSTSAGLHHGTTYGNKSRGLHIQDKSKHAREKFTHLIETCRLFKILRPICSQRSSCIIIIYCPDKWVVPTTMLYTYRVSLKKVSNRILRAMLEDKSFGPLWAIQVVLGHFDSPWATLAHESGLPRQPSKFISITIHQWQEHGVRLIKFFTVIFF